MQTQAITGGEGGSMNSLIDLFLIHHVRHLATASEMEGTIRNYFDPLRRYPLTGVTPLIIQEWHHGIGVHSESMANKSLSMLRTMFEKAKDWQLYTGDNPAQRVKKYPLYERERFVTPEEMPRLQQALAREEEATQCYFLLCLLVGCRRTEGLTLKWADLDLDRQVWRKPTTKTGRTHLVPIPITLLHRLQALPHDNEWVFATKAGHWSYSLAYSRWQAVRMAAGLPDVTIHDLRRTCASWLAIYGENLAVISKGVLNHTSLSHTGIYARLNVTPVQRALEENSVRMLAGVR